MHSLQESLLRIGPTPNIEHFLKDLEKQSVEYIHLYIGLYKEFTII